jgi:hypothetical protein
MGGVFVRPMMSLDKFIVGSRDDVRRGFCLVDDVPSGLVDEVIARTGAIVGECRL